MKQRFIALANLKILVIEDEVMIAMLIESFLEDLGCAVEIAPSIQAAMAALAAGAPDGVLLDMNIHGTKPLGLADELVRRAVPFLLVTGYGAAVGDPAVIRGAPRLQKPFTSEELGRRMEEVFVGRA